MLQRILGVTSRSRNKNILRAQFIKDYNPNKGRMIAIDLEKKQAGYWVGNIKNFKKFYTSCKLYKGGSSTLKSSLGNSSGTFKNILGKYLGK